MRKCEWTTEYGMGRAAQSCGARVADGDVYCTEHESDWTSMYSRSGEVRLRRAGNAQQWVLQDREPQRDGTPGGDGAHEAYSVRWLHRDRKAAVTVSWYVVDLRERCADEDLPEAERWDVEYQVERITFEDAYDIGGTETWSDVEDNNPYEFAPESETTAEAWALHGARGDLTGFMDHFEWDGLPK